MSSIFIVLLVLFFYSDLSLMIRQNKEAFRQAFYLHPVFYILYISLFLYGSISLPNKGQLYAVIFAFGLPLYLIKRYRFRKLLYEQNPSLPATDDNVFLAFDAFGIVLLWLLIMVTASLVVGSLYKIFSPPESKLGEVVAVSIFSSLIFIFLIYRIVNKYPRLTLSKTLGLTHNQQSLVKLILLPALCGFIIAIVAAYILFFRNFQPVTPMDEMIDTTTSPVVLVFFMLSAVLMAPLFEELIFRGFFFYIIKRFKGEAFAIGFIALTFAALHFDQYWGDLAAIGMVTFLGFALTFFRAWTGTTWPSIVMHYTFNGSMMIIPIVFLLLTNPPFFKYQVSYQQLSSIEKEGLLYQSIDMQPDYAEAYNELAWLFAEEERNLPEALHLIEKGLSLTPNRFAFRDTKAEVLYKLGRSHEAIEIAKDLVKKYPSNRYAKKQLKKFKQSLTEDKSKDPSILP